MEEIMKKQFFTLATILTIGCWGGLVAMEENELQPVNFFALVAKPKEIFDEIAEAIEKSPDVFLQKTEALEQAINAIKQTQTEKSSLFSQLITLLENVISDLQKTYSEQANIEMLQTNIQQIQELQLKLYEQGSRPAKALASILNDRITNVNQAIQKYLDPEKVPTFIKQSQQLTALLAKTMTLQGKTDDIQQPLFIVPLASLHFFDAAINEFTEGKTGIVSFGDIPHSFDLWYRLGKTCTTHTYRTNTIIFSCRLFSARRLLAKNFHFTMH